MMRWAMVKIQPTAYDQSWFKQTQALEAGAIGYILMRQDNLLVAFVKITRFGAGGILLWA
jgi:hypothetical protein